MWLVLQQDRGSAFLLYCLCGFVIGSLYDVFRVARVICRGGKIRLFFEDAVFCVMAALLFVVFAFNISMGVIRMFSAAGALLGFFIYRFTLGLATVRMAKALKALIKPPLQKLISYIKVSLDKSLQRVYTICRGRHDRSISKKGFSV